MPIRLITSYSTLQLFSITANEIIMYPFIAGIIEYFIIAKQVINDYTMEYCKETIENDDSFMIFICYHCIQMKLF